MDNEINLRIKEIRTRLCDGNNTDFAGRVGESPQTTSNWMGREGAGIDVIGKVLKAFPEVCGDWLLTGDGNMLKNEPSATSAPDNQKFDFERIMQENEEVIRTSMSAMQSMAKSHERMTDATLDMIKRNEAEFDEREKHLREMLDMMKEQVKAISVFFSEREGERAMDAS